MTYDQRKYLPLLRLPFAASGCSALIYEILWYQMLVLAVGSTAVSMGVLLATYMGGLCIGSLWLPRARWAQGNPLRTYAAIEGGIAGFGLLVLVLLPLVGQAYLSIAAHGLENML